MASDGVSYFATQDSDSSVPDQTSQRVTHQMFGFCPVSGLLIQSQLSPTERSYYFYVFFIHPVHPDYNMIRL